MITIDFLITSLVIVLIPGTGVIYTISTGLFQGFRASVFAAIGCTLGIVPHLMASVLGLATILHISALAFQIIKYLGVAYLLYLAYSMWRQTGGFAVEKPNQCINAWDITIKGTLINILNPKLSLFFLAFLPQFIPTQATNPLTNMLILSGVFMFITLLIFILYGFFADSVRTYLVGSEKIIKLTQRSFAAIFAALGVKLALVER